MRSPPTRSGSALLAHDLGEKLKLTERCAARHGHLGEAPVPGRHEDRLRRPALSLGAPHPRELRVRESCAGSMRAGYAPDFLPGLPAGRLGLPGWCGACLPIGNGRCRWGNGLPTGCGKGGHDAVGVGLGDGLAVAVGVGLGDHDGCGLGDPDGCGNGPQPGRKGKWWGCRRANPQYAAILLAPPAACSSCLKAAAFCAAVPCLSARKKATQAAGTLKW